MLVIRVRHFHFESRWQKTVPFIDSSRKRIISREINITIAARCRCPRLRNDIKVSSLFSRSLQCRCNRSARYPVAAQKTFSIKLHPLYEYRNDHSRNVARIPRLLAETAISKIRKPRSTESLPECSLLDRDPLFRPGGIVWACAASIRKHAASRAPFIVPNRPP